MFKRSTIKNDTKNCEPLAKFCEGKIGVPEQWAGSPRPGTQTQGSTLFCAAGFTFKGLLAKILFLLLLLLLLLLMNPLL